MGRTLVLVFFLSLAFASLCARGEEVTYDGRSLIINGTRRILFSGSIHYPRSTPEMWPSLITRAKQGGLDVIQTYVFWNVHEPFHGQFNFKGRYDLVAFIKEIQAQGLYVSLRIGPFIQSEWKYGGFPFWLHDIPGIVFRSDNVPFKYYMQRFVSMIVSLMKTEKLFASQGGPIIVSQVENEYQMVEAAFHEKGPPYVEWAGRMVVGLKTGVPWMMCKQDDAPDPVINSCNGMRCGETWIGPNSPNKPAMWTENWTSFIQVFGGEPYYRSAKDIAFGVALFIASKSGSFINYYMYHGGTNFGRSASSYVMTGYYDQAPLDEYGLIRQPKWGHLRELHAVIKLCSETLLHGSYSNASLGKLQDVYVFQDTPKKCVAFLSNRDRKHDATVLFRDKKYNLPPRSISILPDCKNVVFNTALVSAPYSTRTITTAQSFILPLRWTAFMDETPNYEMSKFSAAGLLEQLNATKDETDYLWYSTRFVNKASNHQHVLHVASRSHIIHAFVNGVYAGTSHGNYTSRSIDFKNTINLEDGENDISLLSVMVGSPDSGPYLERRVAGLRRVKIEHSKSQTLDISNYRWGYKVGLSGEETEIYTGKGSNRVIWKPIESYLHQRLVWYKTNFDAPRGDDPIVLNLASMGKGEAWVNGESIGRYWVAFNTSKGQPSQTRYHVPKYFLKPSGNLLVLFEEMGGNPLQISLQTVSLTNVCGVVSHSHHTSLFSHRSRPNVELHCDGRKSISAIRFASYGTPEGYCQKYSIGSCHAASSKAVVEKACLGKMSCSVVVSSKLFGGDPCPGVLKSLLIAASCH